MGTLDAAVHRATLLADLRALDVACLDVVTE
jgi:hypothetical protein